MPLSCLLFNLVIEIIAARIRQNENIEGITIGTKTKKLGQYADDLWLSLKHKRSCYTYLFREFEKFAEYTGLKINYNKTEMIRLGSLIRSDANFYSNFQIQWSDKPIKILGIYFWSNNKEMTSLNYQKILEKTRNICELWSKRS